ncbi:RNA polymerase sigma factor FliA [Paraburkholderia sp. SIMBA_054]|uniref:RNA polymerase sigma factor FliA n=1 Tax=Paraburkholderia sp. SIMBA_054 TaxID=3085795 RepID=UPI00397A70DE
MSEQSSRLDPEQLVEQYGPLVRKLARQFTAKVPPNAVDIDDMMSEGTLALLSAAKRYDPSQGTAFETYASQRIWGAMLDELRKNDFAPRGVREDETRIERATSKVEQKIGRRARDMEVAGELDVPVQQYQSMLIDSNRSRMIYLDDITGPDLTDGGHHERQEFLNLLPSPDLDPLELLVEQDTRARIVEVISELPARYQDILELIYDSQENIRAIAAKRGICPARVCQLRDAAILAIRTKLAERMLTE